MSEKQLVIDILERLARYREGARALLVVVESSDDDKIVEDVLHLLHVTMNIVESQEQKNNLGRSIEALERLKDLECQNESLDTTEAEKLLDQFDC